MELVKYKECNYISRCKCKTKWLLTGRGYGKKSTTKSGQTEHDFKCDYMNYYLTS